MEIPSEENESDRSFKFFQNLSKIFNEFCILAPDKKKIKDYLKGENLQYKIVFSSNSSNHLMEDDKLKFFVPFPQKIRTVKIENKIGRLNEILFQEKMEQQKQEFFCVALNSHSIFVDSENYPLFTDTNPNEFHFYYCVKIQEFFIQDHINIKKKYIKFHFFPKFLIF